MMVNKSKKQYEDDDGRVICDMNVEGMRWFDKSLRRNGQMSNKVPQGTQLTRSEARRYTWYSLLAGLSVAGVFSVTWILFILFCTQIWFR
ncbi:MAG: hypothetical protein CL609_16610 [Anaerolineaceae bacterium]|nr:hypothetical protein [Anaerolineaceae bacterium]